MSLDRRVIVLGHAGADLDATIAVLARSHIAVVRAEDSGVVELLEEGAAALVLLGHSCSDAILDPIAAWLERQPPWSDLPVLALLPPEPAGEKDPLERLGNVTRLDSPVSAGSLASAARAALRARQRQYREREVGAAERLRTLMDAFPLIASVSDPAGRILYVSRYWETWSGRSAEDFIRGDWQDAIHAADRARVIGAWQQALASKEPYEYEFRARARDGSHRWLLARGAPALTAAGEPELWVSCAIDIDALKRAQEDLQESEHLFRTLGEAVPDFLWMSDAEGRPIYQNPAWRRYVGMSHEELAERGWSTVHHPDDLPMLQRVWAEALRTGEAFEVETRARRHDGVLRWFAGRTVPLKDDTGKVVKWVGTMTDIHARKEAEEALATADRRKDEFLAVLAHELRNPLAPLSSWLAVLQMKNHGDPAVMEPVRTMQRQVAHMVRLVDDLLDVSRITRGKIELRKEKVDLAALVRDVIDTAHPQMKSARHDVSVLFPSGAVTLEVDPVRLTQALSNLLHNAAKFTPPGGKIDLALRRDERGVAIAVRDTGRGIPPEKLHSVFDMFSQVDSRDRSRGGLGIGLFLARRLVEMHGGSVEAHSEGLGRGSEFVLRLPLPVADSDHPAPEREKRPARIDGRVLVVDDNRDAAESLGELLRLMGAQVDVVFNGPDALVAIETHRPGAVLLDIDMPGMDGYEVAREVRKKRELDAVKLVALSGWGHEEARRRAEEAGCDGHLTKPTNLQALLAVLSSL